ncbi:MAG: hypothetical protein WC264_03495 [Candidatus Paceibacterota bacterium]|jgi:hypothetical protein
MKTISKDKDFVTTSVEVVSSDNFNELGIVTSKVPFSFVEIFIRKSYKSILKFFKENEFDFPLVVSIFHDGGSEVILKADSEEIDLKNLLSISIQYNLKGCHTFKKETERFLKKEEEVHDLIHKAFSEAKKLGH